MKPYYMITKKEEQNMSAIFFRGNNALQAVFEQLPKRVTMHSERVKEIAGIIMEFVPDEMLPEGMYRGEYCFALLHGAYYHEIGIYLGLNDTQKRPSAAKRFLEENLNKEESFNTMVLETVCSHWERYDGSGFPDGMAGEDIPFHASLLAIIDTVDMIANGKMAGWKFKKAAEYIKKNSGVLFHPEAVRCFELAEGKIREFYLNSKTRTQSADTNSVEMSS